MRVCIVTETYPPEVNGVAMTLQRVARGLESLGHSVQVVRPRQASEARGTAPEGETIVPGVPLPGYAGLRMGLFCTGRLKRRWRRERPDVLYVATEGPLGLSAIRAGRDLGIPLTSGFHTNFHEYMRHYRLPLLTRFAEGFLRRTHNLTRRTFVPSPDAAERLRESGIENVRILGRGVDRALFSPARRDDVLRREWGAGPEDPVAIFVSRIAAEKNLPLLLRAFARVRERCPGAACVLVGDGPELPRLRREYPEFHYEGMKRGEDLARHYASGDLFVFPSTTETFGNVVTEAMASGLVPVAYDYAAPRQFVRDGENGFLAVFEDGGAYLAALDRALDRRADWPALGRAARESTAELDWTKIVRGFVKELEEAAGA
jgi:glycosyltransferase involved in cell wall biosynthesis